MTYIRKRLAIGSWAHKYSVHQFEINVRQKRLMERRTKAADFRGLKTLEDFDWSFNPAIYRKVIYDLATGNFIRQSKDVFFWDHLESEKHTSLKQWDMKPSK